MGEDRPRNPRRSPAGDRMEPAPAPLLAYTRGEAVGQWQGVVGHTLLDQAPEWVVVGGLDVEGRGNQDYSFDGQTVANLIRGVGGRHCGRNLAVDRMPGHRLRKDWRILPLA